MAGNIKIDTVSCHSLKQEVPSLPDIVHSHSLDILDITEAWLT